MDQLQYEQPSQQTTFGSFRDASPLVAQLTPIPRNAFYVERTGGIYGGITCNQDLAYEIIVREVPETLQSKYGLQTIRYNGEVFLIESERYSDFADAVNEIGSLMSLYTEDDERIAESEGESDLGNVEYSANLEFLGERECLFCGNSFLNGEQVRRTTCMHLFHVQCLTPWLKVKKVCPIDKLPIK